jgi:hypothetical protein
MNISKIFLVKYQSRVIYPGAPIEEKQKYVIAADAKDVWDAYDSSKNERYGAMSKVISVEEIGEVDSFISKNDAGELIIE